MKQPIPTMPMTADGADMELLFKTSMEKEQMIMLPLAPFGVPELQRSWARAMAGGWLQFIDMIVIVQPPHNEQQLMKVFKLTDAGRDRLRQLRATAS